MNKSQQLKDNIKSLKKKLKQVELEQKNYIDEYSRKFIDGVNNWHGRKLLANVDKLFYIPSEDRFLIISKLGYHRYVIYLMIDNAIRNIMHDEIVCPARDTREAEKLQKSVDLMRANKLIEIKLNKTDKIMFMELKNLVKPGISNLDSLLHASSIFKLFKDKTIKTK